MNSRKGRCVEDLSSNERVQGVGKRCRPSGPGNEEGDALLDSGEQGSARKKVRRWWLSRSLASSQSRSVPGRVRQAWLNLWHDAQAHRIYYPEVTTPAPILELSELPYLARSDRELQPIRNH